VAGALVTSNTMTTWCAVTQRVRTNLAKHAVSHSIDVLG
jgi:hypothetical protein